MWNLRPDCSGSSQMGSAWPEHPPVPVTDHPFGRGPDSHFGGQIIVYIGSRSLLGAAGGQVRGVPDPGSPGRGVSRLSLSPGGSGLAGSRGDITVRSAGGNLGTRRVRQRRCPRPARHAGGARCRLAPRDLGADIPPGPGTPGRPELDVRPGPGRRCGRGRGGSLPEGQAVAREITAHDYDMAALVIPGDDPELADVALAALLITAGRDDAWHQCWVDAGAALQARQTTDQLASVFYHYEHRCVIRNCPWNPDGLPAQPITSGKTAVEGHVTACRGTAADRAA